jgi:hypothetical protein
MGSLVRRLEALEMRFARSTAEEQAVTDRGREQLARKAIHGAQAAMAHIERAAIDPEPLRYEVERLKEESLVSIACYIATLSHMGHPGETRAREILREAEASRRISSGESPAWRIIDFLEGVLDRRLEGRAERPSL